MSKGVICHISVLNPLMHSRIFYRWAKGAQKLGYETVIFAQGSGDARIESISLQATGLFSRLSLKRLFFNHSHKHKFKEVEADIYVLHSPELLGLGRWLKERTSAKVIYDAHEDYYKNIIHAPHYPAFLRKPLARWVRKKESMALDYLDAVVYAEDCYEGMLPADSSKTFFLRNKFAAEPDISPSDFSEPYMLSTGTLAWAWGVKESCELWKAICFEKPIRWVLAGHTNDRSVLEFVREEAARAGLENYLSIIGGESYVPYEQIIKLIRGCYFGTAFYHLQPNIVGKIPTKFYEFMSLGKPLLFTKEFAWEKFNLDHPFGLSVKWGEWENSKWVLNLHEQLQKWHSPKESLLWGKFESELPTLKSLLESLCH
ncbi:MAG: hypothetical protein MRZ79_02740 [Bacteroidia bacterium]|nr:hypothetical protein [Bacteroidia bacterium]